MMPPLIAGNWKMNGRGEALTQIAALAAALRVRPAPVDILICPPATLISRAWHAAAGQFDIGGQDCHAQACGAFTGAVSAEMLADAGAMAVIVGHSERRHFDGETNAIVREKARAAWRAGLLAIVCIGESAAQRHSGDARAICAAQLAESVPDGALAANTVVAYEPLWAVGAGLAAATGEIAEMHSFLRRRLANWFGAEGEATRILYGGSVNADDASEILALPDVGGALVGGASLLATDFEAIIRSVPAGGERIAAVASIRR